MVFTRAQLDTLSREELVKELIKSSNIADQLKNLTDRFDDFDYKYEKLQSELQKNDQRMTILYYSIVL